MSENCVASSDGSDGPKLSEIFDNVWKIWEYVENTNDPSVSESFQKRVREGVRDAEAAVTMVNQLQLFTDNEELEEVATNEIRYMLLPALLGYLQCKIVTDDRLNMVKKSQLLYTDYLQMCKSYQVTNIDIPEIPEPADDSDLSEPATSRLTPAPASRSNPHDLVALNAKRQLKIDRFKQQKEMEKCLKELKHTVDQEHVDDEVKREYYTTLLKRWVTTSLEEIEAISGELGILEHMAKMRLAGSSQPQTTEKPKPATQGPGFRPFILTKSSLQKKVFGAGYPSLPSYTVEEFFDQQVALGNMPPPGSMPSSTGPADDPEARERDEVEKEANIEADDEETLRKARNWDDWTDDHRRGWGNTQNKG